MIESFDNFLGLLLKDILNIEYTWIQIKTLSQDHEVKHDILIVRNANFDSK